MITRTTTRTATRTGTRASATRKSAEDALALLKKDHETVRKLLKKLDASDDPSERAALLAEVTREVEVHAAIEEEIFYPAFRQAAETTEDQKLFFEAAEEHSLVHGELPKVKLANPGTELFAARAKVLKDLIEHHAEEEEKELFPRARKLMKKAERLELGQRLQARKETLMASGRFRKSA